MMETALNITLIALGALSLFVPSIELKKSKNDKKLKELTILSKRMLAISFLLVIFGVSNYFVSEYNKSKERQDLKTDLTDSFDTALKILDSSLRYDALNGKIVTNDPVGVIATVGNGATITGNSISNSRFMTTPQVALKKSDIPPLYLLLPQQVLFKEIEKNKRLHHIKSNDIFIYYVNGTSGYVYNSDLNKMLTDNGYKVTGQNFMSKDYFHIDVTNGVTVAPLKGKITLVVGNIFRP